MMPSCFLANGVELTLCNGKNEWGTPASTSESVRALFDRARYSYDVPAPVWLSVRVEYDTAPVIAPGQTVRVRLILKNRMPDPRHVSIRLLLPEGFTASGYRRNLLMSHQRPLGERWEADVTAGEIVNAVNNVVVEITGNGRPGIACVPVTLLG